MLDTQTKNTMRRHSSSRSLRGVRALLDQEPREVEIARAVPKRTRFKNEPHVSTKKLLDGTANFAIQRCPCSSSTLALGRAPPRERPGAISMRSHLP